MLKKPIVMEVFWDESANGKPFNNIQLIDDTTYFWRSYVDNKLVKMSIYDFLERMKVVPEYQMNFSINKTLLQFKNDDSIFSFIDDEELKNYTKSEFRYNYNNLCVIARCPICGKLSTISYKQILRTNSFICTSCNTSYMGAKKFNGKGKYLKELVDPKNSKYWSKNNRNPFEEIQPLAAEEYYNLICPICGVEHKKNLQAILKSGFCCTTHTRKGNLLKKGRSLRDVYPELADMWDLGNNDLDSSQVTAGSSKQGKFVCSRGGVSHYYIRPIYSVAASYRKGNTGCPVCNNKAVWTGINDFATLYPECIKDWDYENNPNPPEKTLCSNTATVALICPVCGKKHIKDVQSIRDGDFGSMCNSCARITSMRRKGKVTTLHQQNEIVADMIDNAPNPQKSKDMSAYAKGRYNFYCDGSSRGWKPHIFQASLVNVMHCVERGSMYNGCPICAGRQVETGVNDFETLNPTGSSMWDYSKNNTTPDKVYAYSEDQYWFKCKNGHEFQRDPLHMMRSIDSKTGGCPVCYGRRVIVGVNDMATTMPDTLDRWEYDLNDFTPHDVTENSNRRMLARCQVKSCKKVYETDVYNWSHNLVRRCPDCRNSQISTSEQNIVDMISGYGIKVEQQYPIAGGKYLLDTYLPEKGIAFEYNGIYWHSAEKRGLTYHEDKYSMSSKFGITLYNIWSDDYDRNPDLVCKLIKKKIQPVLSDLSPKEFDLSFIDREAAEPFILKNSLVPLQDYQYSGESEYIGIFLNGLLAATAQLREIDDNTIEIYGYCELLSVPEKERLIEEFCKTNTGYSIIRVVHEISSIGDLLNRMGTLWKTLPPKGYFVLGTQRVEQLPEDLYQEEYRDLSIEQVSQKSGIEILYNVGYEVWEKEI